VPTNIAAPGVFLIADTTKLRASPLDIGNEITNKADQALHKLAKSE
jgi:hypothetical protein